MATSIKVPLFKTVGLIFLLLPVLTQAQEIPPPAYQLAAQNAGVPSEVLYAVALTESGLRLNDVDENNSGSNRSESESRRGRLRPWPWTLNIAGKGRFFKTREDACLALTETLKTVSAKRVDVGVAQINYGYHSARVNAPCDLLDPYLNLSIAATILKEQHKEGEDWLITIGRYHSPANGSRAASYRNAANRHLARITASNP